MRQILLVRAFLRREVESRSTGRWVSRTLYPVLAEEASGPCCLKACLDGRGSRGMRSDLGLSKAILSCFEDCRALAGFRRGPKSIDSEGRKTKRTVARRRALFCRCRAVSTCGRENADYRVRGWEKVGVEHARERHPCGLEG